MGRPIEAPFGYAYEVAGGGGIHPGQSIQEAQAIQKQNGRNTESFYRKKIFNPGDAYVVDVQDVQDGKLGTAAAKPGWGPKDIVVHALGTESLQPVDEAGHVAVETADMLPNPVQRKFSQFTTALQLAAEESFPGTVFTEYETNSPYARGNDEKRNPSKTLHKPHRRVVEIPRGNFTPSEQDWEFPHLKEERAILSKHLPDLVELGRNQLQEMLDLYRINMSLGEDGTSYRFELPFGREKALHSRNVAKVHRLLQAHAQMYREVMNTGLEEASGEGFMADTWRMKRGYNDEIVDGKVVRQGNYVVEIAPAPVSGAGCVEVFEDAFLKRNDQLTPEIPESALKNTWTPVVEAAKAKIAQAEGKRPIKQRVVFNRVDLKQREMVAR